jgi:hypothetical protein
VHVQAIEQRQGRRHAGLLVVEGPDTSVDTRRRCRLAEVVADGAKHDGREAGAIEVAVEASRLVDHQQRVRPHIAFGMPLRFLLAAGEGRHLRKDALDDPRSIAS